MGHNHAGHRKRMIAKLESGVLLEHELLEIMLFPLMPRKNTNDLAHRLLAGFGSLYGVYSASIGELQQVEGIGENIAANIYCSGLIFRNYFPCCRQTFEGKFESKSFIPYVKELYAGLGSEVVDVYLLNGEGDILKTHRFTNNAQGMVEFTPSDLAKLLLSDSPSGVVIVHNHPVGEATYSAADEDMTKRCQLVCSMHGTLLCDHIIYAPNGVYSYYLSGKLQSISKSFSVSGVTTKEEKDHEKEKNSSRKT